MYLSKIYIYYQIIVTHILSSLFLFANFLVASAGDSFKQPELFDFDHIHFDSSADSPVAILYGALGTDCFRKFHVSLVEAAKEVVSIGVPYNTKIVTCCWCCFCNWMASVNRSAPYCKQEIDETKVYGQFFIRLKCFVFDTHQESCTL